MFFEFIFLVVLSAGSVSIGHSEGLEDGQLKERNTWCEQIPFMYDQCMDEGVKALK